MPEGPETRRVADRLRKSLAGSVCRRVRFGLARLEPWESVLSGARVLEVEARGKALLTTFDSGHVLYSHNQLYGRWFVVLPDRAPRTNRQLRVALETSTCWALLYSASDIEVLDAEHLDEHPFLARIGPDVLDSETTPVKIRERLLDPRFAGRKLGNLLMDQSFLAGLGNYLRSEILFFAGLPPDARPRELDVPSLTRLARQTRRVALRSYRTAGVTETSAHATRARAAGEPRRSWRHAVFGRRGRACRRCRTPIAESRFGGRRLYLCPSCQGSEARRAGAPPATPPSPSHPE